MQGYRIRRRQVSVFLAARRNHAGGANAGGRKSSLLPNLAYKRCNRGLTGSSRYCNHGFRLRAIEYRRRF